MSFGLPPSFLLYPFPGFCIMGLIWKGWVAFCIYSRAQMNRNVTECGKTGLAHLKLKKKRRFRLLHQRRVLEMLQVNPDRPQASKAGLDFQSIWFGRPSFLGDPHFSETLRKIQDCITSKQLSRKLASPRLDPIRWLIFTHSQLNMPLYFYK